MTEFWDRRAKQFLVISAIILLLFFLFKVAKYYADVLAILGISILIAYLFIGPVNFITRFVKIRSVAIVLFYFILVSFFAAIFIFIGPKVIKEFGEFTRQIPNILNSLDSKIQDIEIYLYKNKIPLELPSVVTGISNKFGNLSLDTIGNAVGVAIGTVHIVFYALITSVTSYYFLLDGHKIIKDLIKYIPTEHQHHIHALVTELDKCLRGFYGGMVKLAGINACVMFSTYMLMKVPYALLLALWHFLWCIIPVVGGWVGLVPALMVIAFTDPFQIWIPLVVYEGFTRLIKDNFITPKVMGDAIGIHPVIVLFAVLVGLKTAGLVGVLFALPLFGALNVTTKYILEQTHPAKAD